MTRQERRKIALNKRKNGWEKDDWVRHTE
jgi:hypothetical protein